MDYWFWLMLMEVAQSVKDLDAVLFYDSYLSNFILLNVSAESAASDHLGDENDLLLVLVLPAIYKVQDIFVLQIFDQVYL